MQRHRVSGSFQDVPYAVTIWGTPNPKPNPQGTGPSGNSNGTVVTMDDYVTPRFKRLQNMGSIICNPMSRKQETRTAGTGTLLMTLLPFGGRTSTTFYEIVNVNPSRDGIIQLGLDALATRSLPDLSRLRAETRTRALANVAKPDFAGLVSLGELRESLHYLRNPFRGAMKLAGALEWRIGRLYREEQKRSKFSFHPVKDKRKGKLHPDDARIVAELENIYLEFRYGVRPMIQEITSALENTREKFNPRPKRQTFRARGEQTFTDSWTALGSTGTLGCTFSYDYERKTSISAGLLYEFTSDAGIGDKWGLQLGQVPQTLWALAPLSFVVDWGLNVSQFIAALTPSPGTNRLCEWETIRTDHKLTRSYSGFYEGSWDSHQSATGGKSPDTVLIKEYTRIPFLGLPDLVFKQNAVETFSEAVKVLDLATLFHQRVGNALSMGKSVTDGVTRRTGRPHAATSWFG